MGAGKYTAALLMGPPGSGKGTQAHELVRNLPRLFCSISTGDLFRRIQQGGDLAKELEQIAQGEFASDEAVTKLLDTEVRKYQAQGLYIHGQHTLLLDGYPRNLEQVKLLDERADIVKVVVLDVPDDTLIERIAGRAREQGRKEDQDSSKIQKRLEDYQTLTAPVIEHYEQRGLVRRFDGSRSMMMLEYEIRMCILGDSRYA